MSAKPFGFSLSYRVYRRQDVSANMHEIADLIRYGRFTATHPTSRHSLFRQQSNYPAKICDRRVMKQAALLQVGLESA
jgi:hypothetical protein